MNIHEQKVESKSYHTIEMNEFVERRERERERENILFFLVKKIIRRERKKKLISYIRCNYCTYIDFSVNF